MLRLTCVPVLRPRSDEPETDETGGNASPCGTSPDLAGYRMAAASMLFTASPHVHTQAEALRLVDLMVEPDSIDTGTEVVST